jgi:hypothetical protein
MGFLFMDIPSWKGDPPPFFHASEAGMTRLFPVDMSTFNWVTGDNNPNIILGE